MNRGQLKTRVSRLIGIAIGTSADEVDENAFLEELANEAVQDILSRTRIYVRDANIALNAGSTEFDVDNTAILKLYRMERGGTALQEQTPDALDAYGYYWAGYNRFVLGLVAAAGETIHVLYTPVPTPMTNDLHDPSDQNYGRIPPQFHRAIVNYMCWHAADKAGDEQVGRGERYRVYYEGQDGAGGQGSDLGRIKTAINQRSGTTRVARYRETLQSDVDSRYWT